MPVYPHSSLTVTIGGRRVTGTREDMCVFRST